MDFEKQIQAAVDDKVVAGAALIAADKASDGPTYLKALGYTDIKPGAPAFQLDSVMWIASCTKLSTSIAVLQLVERGLLALDTPMSTILPEWANPQILSGFTDSNTPIITPATTAPTLRQLLTHSGGLAYDGMNERFAKYRLMNGDTLSNRNSSVTKDHLLFLSFEPGQGWEYGMGIDWAGKMLERVTSLSLGEYMDKHIWKPLGMTHTTFRPLGRPDMMEKMVGRFMRGPDGTLAPAPDDYFPIIEPEDDCGGSGLYSCAADYIKILHSLLKDDGQLLKPETVELMFSPQLPDPKWLQGMTEHPVFAQYLVPGAPKGLKWNWGLGGIIAVDGAEGRWGPGTMMWSGLPNSYWYVDRAKGVCGFYGAQLYPPGDIETGKLNAAFQLGMYEKFAK